MGRIPVLSPMLQIPPKSIKFPGRTSSTSVSPAKEPDSDFHTEVAQHKTHILTFGLLADDGCKSGVRDAFPDIELCAALPPRSPFFLFFILC